ncbi:hypothetical protein TEA_026823 [Camellia sinensis var. sinensis]|uniref:Thioredoxin domain-containing protein n=1 Tax=Camellia sinensis var. sinensis TaxID=542762 RepID=A0A4S4EAV5_CAMSN|nr:hypothetical protein TEA_026823 [Camellia sinensis var. sinensis]
MGGSVRDMQSKGEVDSVMKDGSPVIIHFWAFWCQASKQMDQLFSHLSTDFPHSHFLRQTPPCHCNRYGDINRFSKSCLQQLNSEVVLPLGHLSVGVCVMPFRQLENKITNRMTAFKNSNDVFQIYNSHKFNCYDHIKVEAEEQPEISEAYSVSAVPYFVFLKVTEKDIVFCLDGKTVDTLEDADPSSLANKVAKIAGSIAHGEPAAPASLGMAAGPTILEIVTLCLVERFGKRFGKGKGKGKGV